MREYDEACFVTPDAPLSGRRATAFQHASYYPLMASAVMASINPKHEEASADMEEVAALAPASWTPTG